MAESYPQQEIPPTYEAAPPKKRMNGWVIALIVIAVLIVLCCICVFGVLLLGGPAVGNVFSDIIRTLEVTTPMP